MPVLKYKDPADSIWKSLPTLGVPASLDSSFKYTRRTRNGNYTTTSTTRTPIDATNLGYLTLDLAIGDVVILTLDCVAWHSSAGNAVWFDFEVDKPVSANAYVNGDIEASGLVLEPASSPSYHLLVAERAVFVATEAGVHGFRPVWYVATGTGTILNANGTNAQTLPITFVIQKISSAPVAPSVGLLASKQYNPGSSVQKSTTSATFADIDATNLFVTFTAPSSGSVLVRLSGQAYISGGSGTEGMWNLRDAAGDISGTETEVMYTGAEVLVRPSVSIIMSSLTPGVSYTYKWGFRRRSGTGTFYLQVGTGQGPAVMEVWAA